MRAAVIGRIRSGKSYFSVRVGVEKLLERENVFIRTNLALREVPVFLAYIEKEHGVRIDPRRVELITHEEAKEFCFKRAGGLQFKRPVFGTDDSLRMDRVYDSEGNLVEVESLCPVCYILDEVQVFWPAGLTDKWLIKYISDYLTQSGKLGDDVFMISSDMDAVDKAILRKIDEWYECRFLGKEAWFGVRLPRYFQVRKYLRKPNFFSKPMDTQTYPINVETIGALYKTEAGVGILGTMADKQQRPKGIDWRLAACLLVVAMIVGTWAITAMIRAGQKSAAAAFSSVVGLKPKSKPVVPAVTATNAPPAAAALPAVASPPPVTPPVQTLPERPLARQPVALPGQPTGYLVRHVPAELHGKVAETNAFLSGVTRMPDGRWFIGLSSGETYWYPDDREVEYVDGKVVKIRGRYYEFSRKPVNTFVAPPPQFVPASPPAPPAMPHPAFASPPQ